MRWFDGLPRRSLLLLGLCLFACSEERSDGPAPKGSSSGGSESGAAGGGNLGEGSGAGGSGATHGSPLEAEGRNETSLHFVDEAAARGVTGPNHCGSAEHKRYLLEEMGSGCALFDADGDGDQDLYVVDACSLLEAEKPGEDLRPALDGRARLYRNDGAGRFTDVSDVSPTAFRGYGQGVAVADVDNDGDPDLYVSNIGPNRLYVNQGDGTFVDRALDLGVAEPVGWGFATWFWDFDNDGWLDIFAAQSIDDVHVITTDYLGQGTSATWPRLYRNTGGQGFEDVTARAGLGRAMMPMGANYGDVDGDGFPDIYLGTGRPEFQAIVPNLMFRNVEGARFEDETASTGTGLLQKGHGVAFGDVDNDGDIDLFHQAGGMFPGDRSRNALFQNPGYGHRWLGIELHGTTSNRYGVGARIKVTIAEDGATRDIHVVAGDHGSFGGSSLRQLVGLGRAERIDSVEIWWPASGTRQTYTDVAMDRSVRATEGEAVLEPLERRAITLGR